MFPFADDVFVPDAAKSPGRFQVSGHHAIIPALECGKTDRLLLCAALCGQRSLNSSGSGACGVVSLFTHQTAGGLALLTVAFLLNPYGFRRICPGWRINYSLRLFAMG
jgi:hypothetical protein